MLPYRHTTLSTFAATILFAGVLGYGYYEARGMLFGPTIALTSQVAAVHDPFVEIAGKTERISSLSMNDRSVSVTEDGSFNEHYLLTPGVNHIVLRAEDAYGRKREQAVDITYEPLTIAPVATDAPTATSTTPVRPAATSSAHTSSSSVATSTD